MKTKSLFLIAILSLCATALSAQQAAVKGVVKQLHSDMIVSTIRGDRPHPIDTLKLSESGAYQISLPCEKPSMYILSFMTERSPMIHLIVLPKEKITLDMEYDNTINMMKVTSVKGSANMNTYMQFNQSIATLAKKQQAIDNEYSMASTSEERKGELSREFQQLGHQQNRTVEEIVRKNKDNLMSAFLVTYFENDIANHINLYTEVRDALIQRYADDPFVKHVDGVVKQNIGPGMEAPDIVMKNPEGKELKLSDLRGHIVIVDFWASWCRPCRAENPNMVKLYHKYHTAGLEIYSVSLDKDKNEWLKAIQTDGLVWSNHVSDLNGWTSSGGTTYGVMSVPTTVLIDANGKIIAKNLRGNELAAKLQELFGF